jgi:hypothetical protein
MMIITLGYVLSYLGLISSSNGGMRAIDACVAKTLIQLVNRHHNHGIPYPLKNGDEYLLPAGVKIVRDSYNAYAIKYYSKEDISNLRESIYL